MLRLGGDVLGLAPCSPCWPPPPCDPTWACGGRRALAARPKVAQTVPTITLRASKSYRNNTSCCSDWGVVLTEGVGVSGASEPLSATYCMCDMKKGWGVFHGVSKYKQWTRGWLLYGQSRNFSRVQKPLGLPKAKRKVETCNKNEKKSGAQGSGQLLGHDAMPPLPN